MSLIFISHSSQNNFAAIALHDWLIKQGWEELFLDLHPERGIVAGERWEQALHQAANRCDAVILLISQAWLDSQWCRKEFRLALRLNKRIIGLLLEDLELTTLPDELTATWQLVDLATGSDHCIFLSKHPNTGEEQHVHFSAAGLTRLRSGLVKAGLDPRFFEWPPKHDKNRPPYPGMQPLESDDAGIFFGREAETIGLLSRLRRLREKPSPRLLVILGTSGAGKSSFLRAGILPRLLRDEEHFLPLPMVRPEQAVLSGDSGLLYALDKILNQYKLGVTRKEIRHAIIADPDKLIRLLQQLLAQASTSLLTMAGQSAAPVLVLSIDQAEELFQREGAAEAATFLTLLRQLVTAAALPLIIVFTIRSDAYERLQTSKMFTGISQHTFSLTPMLKGAYQTVIEGPAKRLRETSRPLEIEPALTAALLSDIDQGSGKDALPLLAFTLERLYLEYGGNGSLTLAEYQHLGGVSGAIDAAITRVFNAASKDPALPTDPTALKSLLRRGLIPWLASIDPDTHAPRRRICKLSDIPTPARPIIQHMIEQRLLSTDRNASSGETTIEPAHEALLRQWRLLQNWLDEDFATLATLEGLQRAARAWDTNQRGSDWLNHHSGRLEDAEKLKQREDISPFLTASHRHYLEACRALEKRLRDKQLEEAEKLANAQIRAVKRTKIGLMVTMVFVIITITLWLQTMKSNTKLAAANKNLAEKTKLAIHKTQLANHKTRLAKEKFIEANHNFGLALYERAKQEYDHEQYQRAAYYSAQSALKLQPGIAGKKVKALWRKTKTKPISVWSSIFANTKDNINSVAFSPDGEILAAGSDQAIRLWDSASGKLIKTLRGHSAAVLSVCFSPNGQILVSSSEDKTIRLWDVASGNLLNTLQGHRYSVLSVAFSPDGGTIASAGSADNTIALWNVATGKHLQTLNGHTGSVKNVAFSPNGQILASGSQDETIRLWDVTTGKQRNILRGNTKSSLGLVSYSAGMAFSPDGNTLAAGSDKVILLWDVASAQQLNMLQGHTGGILAVAFSGDGQTLASSAWDKTIRLWDVSTGKQRSTLKGHTHLVFDVAFSPDGNTLASGSWDKTVRLWDIAIGKQFNTLLGHTNFVSGITFSPDGEMLATSSWDKTIRLWDVATGKHLNTLRGHTDSVKSVAFSPDGKLLASGSHDHTIRVWDVASGKPLRTLQGHTKWVFSVAFSPHGKTLASGSGDNTMRLWDVATGTPLRSFQGHTQSVESVTFSPNGETLASSSNDRTIRLWHVATGKQLATLQGHTHWIFSVAFSPDGRTLASGSDDMTIRLWDVTTSKQLKLMRGHTEWVRSVAFSPNGDTLASGSWDKTIRLWDVATGKQLITLEGHSDWVRSVAFSSDGKTLASSSWDKTIQLWDVEDITKANNLTHYQDWITTQEHLMGYRLEGLDLNIRAPQANLSGQKHTILPQWSKYHPNHWLPKAKSGNAQAMLQLGIIAHRKQQWEKAEKWYQQALKSGHPKAAMRLARLTLTRFQQGTKAESLSPERSNVRTTSKTLTAE